MTEPTIAEILHYAADVCLWDGITSVHWPDADPASCCAIGSACVALIPKFSEEYFYRIDAGLRNMGLNTDDVNFLTFQRGPKRQGARYAWLKFAAMIAEEQGV